MMEGKTKGENGILREGSIIESGKEEKAGNKEERPHETH